MRRIFVGYTYQIVKATISPSCTNALCTFSLFVFPRLLYFFSSSGIHHSHYHKGCHAIGKKFFACLFLPCLALFIVMAPPNHIIIFVMIIVIIPHFYQCSSCTTYESGIYCSKYGLILAALSPISRALNWSRTKSFYGSFMQLLSLVLIRNFMQCKIPLFVCFFTHLLGYMLIRSKFPCIW